MTNNAHVRTMDGLVRRLNHLNRTQGLSWRAIASRREFEGIPHGTLWNVANGREPKDAELRAALGLPPKTVEVEPCPDCGRVHAQLHTCEDDRKRNRRTKANGWTRPAAWLHRDDAPAFDRWLQREGVASLQELVDREIGDNR